MKAFAFWNQISPRERLMLAGFGLAAFVFVNALLLNLFVKQRQAINAEIATIEQQIKLADFQIAQRPEWAERAAWLAQNRRSLGNPGQAGIELLDRVKSVGQSQQVIWEKPVMVPKRSFDQYQTVSVGVETTTDWPNLVKFMYYLQEPKEAVVFEKMIISTDPKNVGKVKGNFTISQYYAP